MTGSHHASLSIRTAFLIAVAFTVAARAQETASRAPKPTWLPNPYVGGSRGDVYVADRLNNRIQVFDQEGTFIPAWPQFGQTSSVFVDNDDNLFVGATYDTGQSGARGRAGGPSKVVNDRGIVVGHALTGELKYFIPDPADLGSMTDTGTSASGIAEDTRGNIYATDVGPNNLRKYVRVARSPGR